MYKLLDESDFIAEFAAHGRASQFTRQGLFALFEYLEGLEYGDGVGVELDVISLCCEFTEMTLEDYADAYSDFDPIGSFEEAMEHAQENTLVIPVDEETFIIQDY